MENNIKITFTNEEVDEYINELNAAKGNERKINKLLDLKHLPILVAYLRRIGVDEELLSLAAVVEFTRMKMRNVLTSPGTKEWNVTDTGVDFIQYGKYPHPEIIGVDEGTFWLGNEKLFGRKYREVFGELWPVDAYMYLKRKMYDSKDPDRAISKHGFAFLRFKYVGDFCVRDQIFEDENGVKYFSTTRSDTGMSPFTVKRVYAGEPIEMQETENTLKDNYEIYTALFPKYKKWLDKRYLGGKNDLDEKVRIIDSEIYKERLFKFGGKNPLLKMGIEEEFRRYKSNNSKLDSLSEYLEGYDCECEDGKGVIDGIKAIVDSKAVIDENTAKSILDNCNTTVDYRIIKELGYEELKSLSDRLLDETDKLEELLDTLRIINTSNSKLIVEIEEKIKNIAKGPKIKEDVLDKKDREIEFGE